LEGVGIVRRNLFWLSDEQWERIEPHLPTDVRGVERADDRRIISGIVDVLKSGCRWCDCPPEIWCSDNDL
jgi:transposase